jgi:hypothetical protein
MGRIRIDLENCYGIKKLQYEFDFTKDSVYAIYAANGVMKSSLAQTFEDAAKDQPSSDRIFAARASRRKVADESGKDLPGDRIFVVRPYDEEFGGIEKTCILLIDAKLRKQYEEIHAGVEKAKRALLDALQKQSKSKKKNLEAEISSAFMPTENAFRKAMLRIENELTEMKAPLFADVEYDQLFDDQLLAFVDQKNVKAAIESYVQTYNELLANSTFFRKGIFDYFNASQIAKTLASNGFFEAKHSVRLSGQVPVDIKTREELEAVISKEKEAILKDKALQQKFEAIEKLMDKNTALREFRKYLMNNEPLLSRLTNIQQFKNDVWESYLKVHFDLYKSLVSEYRAAAAKEAEIEQQAEKQKTQWEDVIRIFNDRFFVPFRLTAKNKLAVQLGGDSLIALDFSYYDGTDTVSIEEDALVRALSTGEKKALYILNLIFEIEVRRKEKRETLLIIDDLADSFDYRNKYAIIQYLRDISRDPLFKQIIMTHNFDFFRTLESRDVVSYKRCLMASRGSMGDIALEKASGIKNVFLNDLKKGFFAEPKKKIACIPFLRNIIELTSSDKDLLYVQLTSLLHWKSDSANITEKDLDDIYNELFKPAGASTNGKRPMVEIIHEQAKACLTADEGINFENKIVLSMAIRLTAEKFLVTRINDDAFVNGITSCQTPVLLEKFKELFGGEVENIRVLEGVALMTAENIHLNSFMYEPIVDMSDEYLRKLYGEVCALK